MFAAALAAAFAFSGASLAAAPAKKKATGAGNYINLPSITASILARGRIESVLQVEAGLEFSDSRLRRQAEHLHPRLKAACSEALRLYAGRRYVAGRVPDADVIADILQEAVNDALGQEGATLLLHIVIIAPNSNR